jgi:ribosomal 50S subunit-associated protein YjgA (DUF615 family)
VTTSPRRKPAGAAKKSGTRTAAGAKKVPKPRAATRPERAQNATTRSLGGPLQAMARLTGFDGITRAMDRFAASAERAAAILDELDAERLERLLASADRAAEILARIDADRIEMMAAAAERTARLLERLDEEIGVERAAEVFDGLRTLAETADQMNRSLRTLEQLAADIRRLVSGPLGRLPIPSRFRMGGDRTAG